MSLREEPVRVTCVRSLVLHTLSQIRTFISPGTEKPINLMHKDDSKAFDEFCLPQDFSMLIAWSISCENVFRMPGNSSGRLSQVTMTITAE